MIRHVDRWSLPFDVSVVFGLALFAVLLVPVLVVQYRRFGRLSARRVLAVSAVCVYAVALVAYTTLPLPPSTENCGPRGGTRVQLVPFEFVRDIVHQTAGLGFVASLTSAVTLQVVFNVALFVPFGLLVRRFGGRRLGTTVLLGLLTSLVVEVSQGTALWGLYACSYRVADVDDLIANTTGALVGALLAPRFLAWLPRPAQLVPRRLEPTRVTVVRRWTGMVVDATVFAVTSAVVAFVGRVVAELLQLPSTSLPATSSLGGYAPALPAVVAGLATFVLPVLTRSGASVGQRLVWLRPRWRTPPSVARRLLLAAAGTTWALSFALGAVVGPGGLGKLVALVLSFAGVLAPLSVPFTRGARGISLVLAGADLVDSRSAVPAGPTG